MVEKIHHAKSEAHDDAFRRAQHAWQMEHLRSHQLAQLPGTAGSDTGARHLPPFSLTGLDGSEHSQHSGKRNLKVESGDGPYQMLQREHPFRTHKELLEEAHKIKDAMGHKRLKSGDSLTPNEDGSVTAHRTNAGHSKDFTDTRMAGGKTIEVKSRSHHDGGFTEVTDQKETGRRTVHERRADGSFREEERDKDGKLKRTLTHELPQNKATAAGAKPENEAPSSDSLLNLNATQPNYTKIAGATVDREDDQNRRNLTERIQDRAEDAIVRWTGTMPGNLTIGPAQMKARSIERLIKDNPTELGHMQNGNPLVAALDKDNAKLLAKAYFREKADLLNCGLPAIPPGDLKRPEVKAQVEERVRNLWASKSAKDREEALIRLYNPGAGTSYVNEVRKHERDAH